jgi:hypothetical protein
MTQLRDVAQIRMGYTFRGSLKDATSGNTAIIQMKDASADAIRHTAAFARADIAPLSEHYFLREGDLIFRSRGLQNITVMIDQALERTICIAPLMFIRIFPEQPLLPAWLHWYINLPDTQNSLNAFARGTTIRMIAAESMGGLSLLLPPLERQHKIVAASSLNREIMALEARLAEKRQNYSDEALLQYARGWHAQPCSLASAA